MPCLPPPQPSDALREALSALRDGVAHADAEGACAAWRREADPLRADWYAWTVIGDVLRSDDLAARSDHDQAFLDAVCARLAAEPVVLAPAVWVADDEALPGVQREPQVAAGGARTAARAGAPRTGAALLPWRGRTSAGTWVAGAALVGAAVVAWRAPSGGPDAWMREPALATATPADAATAAVPVAMPGGELSPYLYAHRQYMQGPAMAMPGGLRPVALRDDSPAAPR